MRNPKIHGVISCALIFSGIALFQCQFQGNAPDRIDEHLFFDNGSKSDENFQFDASIPPPVTSGNSQSGCSAVERQCAYTHCLPLPDGIDEYRTCIVSSCSIGHGDCLRELVDTLKTRGDAIQDSRQGRLVFVENECHEDIKLALSYRRAQDDWPAIWWDFKADARNYLAHNGVKIRSHNSIFYYFVDSKSFKGKGGRLEVIDGKNAPLIETQLKLDEYGNWNLKINCGV